VPSRVGQHSPAENRPYSFSRRKRRGLRDLGRAGHHGVPRNVAEQTIHAVDKDSGMFRAHAGTTLSISGDGQ